LQIHLLNINMLLYKAYGVFLLIDPHARNCFGMPDPNGICFEAWSKPKAPYVCSRCSRDKNEMKDLTQIEEMLML
jgi:hypothetical protein